MGKTNPINFGVNSYKATSGLASSERLVNAYVEPAPEDSPFGYTIIGTAGLSVWKDLDVGFPIYGMEVMGQDLYVVGGSNVYKIDATKTVTSLGSMPTAPGRVMMTNNGTQVSILTQSGALYYATTSTLTEVTDSDYTDSGSIATLDAYTLATNKEDRIFQWSALNDTSDWAALDFQSVEADSSDLVRVATNNLELWFFKETITEVYYNSGRPGFIFDRKEGVFMQKGCAATHSVAALDGGFFFLGNDKIAYTTNGYQLVPISTFPISQAFSKYDVVSDAFGFAYVENGHKFYCLSFPTEDVTWEYNITTNLWHERESINSSQASGRWRANAHAFFNGQNLFGDFETGIIYESDQEAYEENGTTILRKVISATQFASFSRATLDRFVLMMDTGVGLISGQGTDPELMLRVSIDGGKTWGFEAKEPIGQIGEYLQEVFWTNLGYARSAIFEVTISDPVKFAIVGAYLNSTIGET